MRSTRLGVLDELIAEVSPPARAGRADLPRPRVLLLREAAPQGRGEPRRPAVAVPVAQATRGVPQPVRQGALEADVLEHPPALPRGRPVPQRPAAREPQRGDQAPVPKQVREEVRSEPERFVTCLPVQHDLDALACCLVHHRALEHTAGAY